ncbi:MAG: transcription termination/antitermination protein NusG [Gammaproteobacteria bacterium]|nr:transcription termination/antitermination protein NusG [Gammaproteobacteria bacterium]
MTADKKRWYVLQVQSQFEKRVREILKNNIKNLSLEPYFGEILVPTEEVVEMKGGQRRKSERKFFPGYVLIHMVMTDEAWHMVRHTPHVLGFVGGTSDRPAPISDKEADLILARMEEGTDKPKPRTLYEVGEMVRVTDGPFADFNGVVEERTHVVKKKTP